MRPLTAEIARNFLALRAYVFAASPRMFQALRTAISAAARLRHLSMHTKSRVGDPAAAALARQTLSILGNLRWVLVPLFDIAALERHDARHVAAAAPPPSAAAVHAPSDGAAAAAAASSDSSSSSSSESTAVDPLLINNFLDDPAIRAFLDATEEDVRLQSALDEALLARRNAPVSDLLVLCGLVDDDDDD